MAAAKKRPASEIDDIFSVKPPKAAATSTGAAKPAAVASSSTAATPAARVSAAGTGSKKKDRPAAAAATAAAAAEGAATDSKVPAAAAPPKRVPVTVVDTSKAIETYKPEPLVPKPLRENATEEERKAAEADERFMDSRGTRESPCRFPPQLRSAELTLRTAHRQEDGGRPADLQS